MSASVLPHFSGSKSPGNVRSSGRDARSHPSSFVRITDPQSECCAVYLRMAAGFGRVLPPFSLRRVGFHRDDDFTNAVLIRLGDL